MNGRMDRGTDGLTAGLTDWQTDGDRDRDRETDTRQADFILTRTWYISWQISTLGQVRKYIPVYLHLLQSLKAKTAHSIRKILTLECTLSPCLNVPVFSWKSYPPPPPTATICHPCQPPAVEMAAGQHFQYGTVLNHNLTAPKLIKQLA